MYIGQVYENYSVIVKIYGSYESVVLLLSYHLLIIHLKWGIG